MSDSKEIVFELWHLQERRSYNLMSAAGAGIGYALATISREITLVQSQILLLAMLLWSLSFLCGYFVVRSVASAMFLSKNAIEFGRSLPDDRTLHDWLKDQVKRDGSKIGWKSLFFHRAQISLLMLGAFAFTFVKIDVLAALTGALKNLGLME